MKTGPNLSAWLVGFIFSFGLGISGMTDPQKVIGFLDVFGSWDPALIFVMAGAIGVHIFTYRLIRKRQSPLLSPNWHVPQKSKITFSLVVGSMIFGIGWGLAGYCPGPAIVSIASFQISPVIFVIGMMFGMFAFKWSSRWYKLNP